MSLDDSYGVGTLGLLRAVVAALSERGCSTKQSNIADALGVSHQAVSRYLSGLAEMSHRTRRAAARVVYSVEVADGCPSDLCLATHGLAPLTRDREPDAEVRAASGKYLFSEWIALEMLRLRNNGVRCNIFHDRASGTVYLAREKW